MEDTGRWSVLGRPQRVLLGYVIREKFISTQMCVEFPNPQKERPCVRPFTSTPVDKIAVLMGKRVRVT